ncbi:hypothetical protein VTK73DRAFT_4947 [Phialemonium thermophilum]|uniref:Uncharacterized protein n=1 Tax=Phialemonium thermophilum TaxID=223376 RepID=A0ABR3WQK4_9PEZI
MEQIRRREMEEAQRDHLGLIYEFIEDHNRPVIGDEELASLGVMKSTKLEIDDPAPIDLEPRYFHPCYDDTRGIEEVGDECRLIWGETLDKGKGVDPEWVPNVAYRNPQYRAKWFWACYDTLSYCYDEDDGTQSGGYNVPYLEDFEYPDRETGRQEMYVSHSVFTARCEDRPHTAILMCDASVAPEDKMLLSELEASVALLRYQLAGGRFTDHHTKPVLVYTIQWETHGRITQAHYDAKINKLVIRQSRILNLSGLAPTSDAYILLRWMMNEPVGETEYKHSEPEEGSDAGLPNNSCGPRVVVTKCG